MLMMPVTRFELDNSMGDGRGTEVRRGGFPTTCEGLDKSAKRRVTMRRKRHEEINEYMGSRKGSECINPNKIRMCIGKVG